MAFSRQTEKQKAELFAITGGLYNEGKGQHFEISFKVAALTDITVEIFLTKIILRGTVRYSGSGHGATREAGDPLILRNLS